METFNCLKDKGLNCFTSVNLEPIPSKISNQILATLKPKPSDIHQHSITLKFHALFNFMYGPIPRVKSECKTSKNLKSSARFKNSFFLCNFVLNFNLDESDCRHVCRLKIHQTLRSQEQVGNCHVNLCWLMRPE